MMAMEPSETKVIYYIDEEETPYLVKLPVPPDRATLADFKASLNRPNREQPPPYKFFFKSMDDDFGIVKEEIVDEPSPLPLYNGRVVSWLVSAEGSVVGGGGGASDAAESDAGAVSSCGLGLPGDERGPGVGETRPPSFHGGPPSGAVGPSSSAAAAAQAAAGSSGGVFKNPAAPPDDDDDDDAEQHSMLSANLQDDVVGDSRRGDDDALRDDDGFEDTESSITSVSQAARSRRRLELRMRRHAAAAAGGAAGFALNGQAAAAARLQGGTDVTSSLLTPSEVDESSVYDTEDAQSLASSRFTTSTEHTSVSRQQQLQQLRQRQQRRKTRQNRRVPAAHIARAGSISSITDSTMSLNIITVTLNMDTVNFLGISIVGQSNKHGDGDCGIYVGSIMKGGAVALDGRIEPGDMILQVNDISFENMSNDDAVRVLREVVQKPGPIRLVVAKCWDTSPKGYFTLPRAEPVRPIDPGAWVAHTAAVRGDLPPMPPSHFIHHGPPAVDGVDFLSGRAPSVTTLSASSIVSSQPETEKFVSASSSASAVLSEPLGINSGMAAIVRAMRAADSGLEVRDRLWLKITISSAFIGSDVVEWLYGRVAGFADKRETRKYASQMLKAGFIKHTVNKINFSEQCYYTFGEAAEAQTLSASLQALKLQSCSESGGVDADPTSLAAPLQAPAWGSLLAPVGGGDWSSRPPINAESAVWAGGGSAAANIAAGGPIYNPAPPPSASNYVPLPYSFGPGGDASGAATVAGGYSCYQPQSSLVTSSGGSGCSQRSQQGHLRLAVSGSGSDSEGRGSTLNGSDGFRAANERSDAGAAAAGFRAANDLPPAVSSAAILAGAGAGAAALTVNSYRTTNSHSQENLGTFRTGLPPPATIQQPLYQAQ